MAALKELFLQCRKGDLERIKYLVEEKEVEVNVRDKWDSTPLYYACLCGHIDVVRYLLEHGARCEANTFDGERCLYGALSHEIRHLLRNFKVVSTQTIRRELYHEFLRKLLETGEYADVRFVVHGESLWAHRCLLCARSDYFYEHFLDRWRDKTVITVNNPLVDPDAFRAVLCYIYTGQLVCQMSQVEDVIRVGKHCKLQALVERLEAMASKAQFLQSTKPGMHVESVLVEAPPDSHEMSSDLSFLAEEALPPAFARWLPGAEFPFLCDVKERAPFADLIFIVEGHRFACHQTFFCARSDYFKTLCRDPLGEHKQPPQPCATATAPCSSSAAGEDDTAIPVVELTNFKASVFLYVLYYVYQESVELDAESVYEVLMAADLCLLPGLKRQCGVFVAERLDTDNAIGALQLARAFDLAKLEDACFEFIADHLEEMVSNTDLHRLVLEDAGEVRGREAVDTMVSNTDLHRLVLEDAGEVRGREAVDTIDVVDNVRYHLTAQSMDDAQQKLALIDQLLETLGVEG